MPTESDLKAQRFTAALASGGISSSAILNLVMRIIDRHQLAGGSVLDFGAGQGDLLLKVRGRELFSSYAGTDILPRPERLPEEIEWVQQDLNYPVDKWTAQFDVILCSEVIEHLENPRATFRNFFKLLKPNGALVLTTPNQESIRSMLAFIIGGHFVAFRGSSYPAHITPLLRLDLERICEETGFTRPVFYYTNSGGLPKLPSIPWQKVSFGVFKGRLFSDNLGIYCRLVS